MTDKIPTPVAPAFRPGDLVACKNTERATLGRVRFLYRREHGICAIVDYPDGRQSAFVPIDLLEPLTGSLGGAG